MNKTTLNSQKEKHFMLSLRRVTILFKELIHKLIVFLSTLSLRRATAGAYCGWRRPAHFYPRSPCGERRQSCRPDRPAGPISIHALLAESDAFECKSPAVNNISIHALLAESDPFRVLIITVIQISIHALLAESDRPHGCLHWRCRNFYPRSPCGERRAEPQAPALVHDISIHALLAESDYKRRTQKQEQPAISIHALLAESDPTAVKITPKPSDFYPRSPCGERQNEQQQ